MKSRSKKNRIPKLNTPKIKKPDLDRINFDDEQKKQMRRFVRRRYKEIIIVSVLAFFFLFSIFHKEKTILLESEKNITSNQANAYIFTESEYVDLKDNTNINFLVKDGQKVGANAKLSKDYLIKTNEFFDDAMKVVDWRLAHKEYSNRDTYFKHLRELQADIRSAESRYSKAESSNDSENMDKNEKEISDLNEELNMMQKSMRYVYADNKELKRIKKEIYAKRQSKDKSLTTSNLNISFSGNVFFERTGFEEVLNLNILPAIDDSYFRDLDNFKPESTGRDVQIIKVVNDECCYVFAFLDKNIYVANEDTVREYNSSVKKRHKLKTDGEYYDYLIKRMDMTITYPTIEFKSQKGDEYEGFLVNVADYSADKKIVAICVNKEFNDLLNLDRTKIDLYTDVVTVYKVPKRAIVKKKGKTYLYKMNKGNIKEKVEVTVYKEVGRYVLLRPYNNENLKKDMEIVVNPM